MEDKEEKNQHYNYDLKNIFVFFTPNSIDLLYSNYINVSKSYSNKFFTGDGSLSGVVSLLKNIFLGNNW